LLTRHHQKPFALNLAQVLKFALFSLLCNPPNILWQGFLEDQFPTNIKKPQPSSSDEKEKKPKSLKGTISTANVLTKFLLDQTIGALVNTLMFLAYMSYINYASANALDRFSAGNAWDVVRHECGSKTWPMMLDGYKFWPVVSLVSFLWVPVERRVVFGCSVGVIWGIYLSFAAS